MKYLNTLLTLTSIAVIGGAALVGASSSSRAQTATDSTASSPDSTSTSLALGARKPTSATPRMIEEAIQRSQARSAKLRVEGKPEQWGSEEPFTYVPGKTF